MRIRSLPVFLCILSGALSSCVAPPVEFDRSGTTPTSVALVAVVEPPINAVINLGSASAFFPGYLFGGLGDPGMESSHTNTYSQMVKTNHVQFSSRASVALTHQLQEDGYRVVDAGDQIVKGTPDKDNFDYSAIRTNADAILHVWFTQAGYASPKLSTGYYPWVGMRVRFLDAKSKKELYFKTFETGLATVSSSTTGNSPAITNISCGEKYRFGSFADLTSQFQDSVDGLNQCINAIIAYVGKDLARTP